MKFEEFKILSEKYTMIPVYEIMTADMLTPVTAYLKIRQSGQQSFLLESVEKSFQPSRYSFIGVAPEQIITNKFDILEIEENGEKISKNISIFNYFKEITKKYNQAKPAELPDFTGGLVGFLGYENIALIEKKLDISSGDLDIPDSNFGVYNTILAFDHYKHQVILINNVEITPDKNLDLIFNSAKEKLNELKSQLSAPLDFNTGFCINDNSLQGIDSHDFSRQINYAKEKITNGDIFQLVLSKRFSSNYEGDTFNVYRALRIINPSPYMYFLEYKDGLKIIGTSPEDLLKVKNGRAQVLPIAGTRKRGNSEEEEKKLEKDLTSDKKELAEHTMLLDLGRNDLGKVCEFGTVKVSQKMKVQKYSHVMHMVSTVEGTLAKDKDSIDALMSCFPAGTVTGAPKISAIQHIKKLEKADRNIYAGAVGYLDYSGNLDMCIAIRTLFAKGNKIYWQSGAGIVADSKDRLEEKEIINKSASMVSALKYAGVLDENPGN